MIAGGSHSAAVNISTNSSTAEFIVLRTPYSRLRVVFRSDFSVSGTGFTLQYTSQRVTDADADGTSSGSGSIDSIS